MRRTQQDELYAAERPVQPGRVFSSQAEIERWLQDEVTETEWWLDRYPGVWRIECPTVTRRAGEGSVGHFYPDTQSGVIEMHQAHWCAKYVLHEIAHVVAAEQGSTSHCPIFAREYLALVREFGGFMMWAELRLAFEAVGIEVAEER